MGRAGLIAGFICLCVLAVFGRLCVAEFTWWDDAGTIHQNPLMNPPTLSGTAAYWKAFGADAPLGLYIPMTYTAWAALAKLAYLQQPDESGIQLNPWVYHTANVALHALSAIVVFLILRLLIRRDWPAAAGALLFALHPVQVEPVGWISGLKDVLWGLLSLVAIWQYIRYALLRDMMTEEPSRWMHYALATAAMLAAMLSKPTAMITPIIAATIDLLVIRGRWRDVLFSLLPWLILSGLCMVSTKLAQPAVGVPAAPVWARPLLALDALAFYLWKLALPVNLAVDYGHLPLRVLESGWVYVTALVPLGLFAALLWDRKKHSLLLAGGMIFVAGVLPVLGLTPFLFQYYSTTADHYLYLSMLGPALGAAYALARWRGSAPAVVSGIVLAALALLSFRQTSVWHDDLTLWQQTIEVNPRSFLAYNNRGAALYRAGQIAQAERHFREAIRLKGDYATAHDNLALVLAATGRTEEAVAEVAEVLRISDSMPPALRPKLDEVHNLFGIVLLSRGEYAKAEEHFRKALEYNPQLESAQTNLAAVRDHARRPTTAPSTGQLQ